MGLSAWADGNWGGGEGETTHLLKIIWKHVAWRGFIFGVPLSLQMAMMGTLVFLIKALRAPTPPRSPDDMPSTSSMMMTERSFTPGFATSPMTWKMG